MATITLTRAPDYVAGREAFQITTGAMRGVEGPVSHFGQLPEAVIARYRAVREDIEYTVMSYATPIAWFAGDGWIIPEVKYSPTTSRHQGIVRQVAPLREGVPVLQHFWPDFRGRRIGPPGGAPRCPGGHHRRRQEWICSRTVLGSGRSRCQANSGRRPDSPRAQIWPKPRPATPPSPRRATTLRTRSRSGRPRRGASARRPLRSRRARSAGRRGGRSGGGHP